jgi:hypothetical protein
MGAAIVHPACSNPVSTCYLDKIGAAKAVKFWTEVVPLPFCIIRSTDSEQIAARLALYLVPAHQCETNVIAIKPERYFAGASLAE